MSLQRKILNVIWVLLLVSAGLVYFRYQRHAPEAFRDCTPGAIAGVPTWNGLGVSAWDGPELVLDPVAPIPGALAASELGGGDWLVATHHGDVFRVDGTGEPERVWQEPDISKGEERGLLDVQVDAQRSLVFTTVTNSKGDLELRSRLLDSFDESYSVVKTVKQLHEYHNGGDLVLGPDSMLYLALGDGGPQSDPGRNGQDLSNILGSIIRIDPSHDRYVVPSDNPLGPDGEPGEMVVYGLRNPWRISFDRVTGELWVADVGNFCIEEVTVVPNPTERLTNLGWSAFEGSSRGVGKIPDEHVPPSFEYARRDGGCAIVGGYVYRGSKIPALEGMYLFSDYCRGQVMGLMWDGSAVLGLVELGVGLEAVTSFGEDADGELYLISSESGVHRIMLAP